MRGSLGLFRGLGLPREAPGLGTRGMIIIYNVDVDCAAPCSVVLRMAAASSKGTRVRVAIGSPDTTSVVASAGVHTTSLGAISIKMSAAIHEQGATVFLLLSSDCTIDWFRFVSGEPDL